MKSLPGRRAAALLLFSTLTVVSAGENKAEPVLLEIGSEKTTVGDFLRYLKQTNETIDFARLPEPEQQRLLDEFVAKKLFAARARQTKLDQKPEVHAKIDFFTDSVLAQEFKELVLNEINVPDQEAAEYYRARKEGYSLPPRVYLQHFLYKSKEKATSTQARLQRGATYAEVAKDKKGDPDFLLAEHSWFTPEMLIQQVSSIAFKLPASQVSEVIGSSFGFHVLRVEDREPSRSREFSEVRAEVVKHLRQLKAGQRYEQILKDMKRSEQVHLYPDNLRHRTRSR